MNNIEMKWGVWLLVIGGLNWGLVGLGYFLGQNLNVVNLILGSWPFVENALYLIIGVCAVWVAMLQIQKK